MIPRLQATSAVLIEALDLTPAQAAVVARLWHAGPSTWVSTELLNEVTAPYARGEQYRDRLRGQNSLRVHVHDIRRKKHDDFFIIGHCFHGYTLGASGVRAVRRAMGERKAG